MLFTHFTAYFTMSCIGRDFTMTYQLDNCILAVRSRRSRIRNIKVHFLIIMGCMHVKRPHLRQYRFVAHGEMWSCDPKCRRWKLKQTFNVALIGVCKQCIKVDGIIVPRGDKLNYLLIHGVRSGCAKFTVYVVKLIAINILIINRDGKSLVLLGGGTGDDAVADIATSKGLVPNIYRQANLLLVEHVEA